MSLPIPSGLILSVLALYIAVLFACAIYGENVTSRLKRRSRGLVFSLALGVYCSSWTFYGAVGEAVRHGIAFLPIYLGPLLFLWLGYDVWQRLGRIRSQLPISSIADFIAARYGKSGLLAALVTVLAILAILPYLALQLRAITLSASMLLGEQNPAVMNREVLLLTALLAVIAMLYSTRQLSNREQHSGLMLAIALESVVKLTALIMVALVTLGITPDAPAHLAGDIQQTMAQIQQEGLPASFWTQTILAAMAMICLPRQFHVSVVELRDSRDIRTARLWFAGYLVLMVAAILPIASWAMRIRANLMTNPDMAVLLFPIFHGQTWLALLAFLGGFSAATGMLLIATLALAIMLSNEVLLPVLWRFGILHQNDRQLSKWLKLIRWLSILVVMALGFAVYWLLASSDQLTALGLLAFSAVIQFAPALLGGLYWRGGSRHGVMAGLLMGFTLWIYTLFLPAILHTLHSTGADAWLLHGPDGWSWLRPEALLGFASAHPLNHGVFWSLGSNILLYIMISRYRPPSIAEQIQTERFFSSLSPDTVLPIPEHPQPLPPEQLRDAIPQGSSLHLRIGDLVAIASRINGNAETDAAFHQFAAQQQLTYDPALPANNRWWHFTEQLLANMVGSASARTLLTTALSSNGLTVGQVALILDQASAWQRFNKQLLITMMDHMAQGVSVVNANMQLVAWNKRYLELFNYPEALVYVGCPVAALIRYNAERGECGPGDVEEHIRKRIQWLQAGSPHEFERQRADGRIIEIRGHPVAGGGFVTTYADITAFRKTEAILEARVDERTQQLHQALQEQQRAREQADLANMSKSRFVAAASHDLLQPMHAARLFAAALEHSTLPPSDQQTLQQLDRSLHGAEAILNALLDIARLDSNTLTTSITRFALNDLLQDLYLQYQPIAEQRHLVLHVHPTTHWVRTDPLLLRRMVQNLLSNALRYTAHGRVVVGVLSSAAQPQHLRLGVWDTGPGIAPEQLPTLFGEFRRGSQTSPWGEQGLGLGLAIVDRMAKLLHHSLTSHSVVGQGASFILEIPLTDPPAITAHAITPAPQHLQPLHVLCLDNERTILDGMKILLEKWGCNVMLATTPDEARALLAQEHVHVLLVDQHLDQAEEGLDFLQHLPKPLPAALITADSDPDLPLRVKAAGVILLRKPLKPAALRAFLATIKTN